MIRDGDAYVPVFNEDSHKEEPTMPKSVMIRPEEVRERGFLEFTPIPVNQYNRTFQEELDRFAREDLVRIQRDMAAIRTFETMLNDVKIKGSYQGIEYNHRGPAHLSIGQEASAVGQAYLLGVDDHIFGSHRNEWGDPREGPERH